MRSGPLFRVTFLVKNVRFVQASEPPDRLLLGEVEICAADG
jgi:hypothetical protein